MQYIQGINITHLPFEELKLQQELIEFEGISVLIHFKDNRGNDILSYMVDFDSEGHRRLYGKVTKNELLHYLVGFTSLKELFATLISEYIFLVDYDRDEHQKSIVMMLRDSIPAKYLPVDDSFSDEGLSEFYLDYLKEDYYKYRLMQNSVIIKAESTNKNHRNAVGARESAFVMSQYTNSSEGFTKVRAINKLQPYYGDSKKLMRKVNSVKNFLSNQIVYAKAASFEVWLSMDTISLQLKGDKLDQEIAKNLIEDYKEEVLNIDYSSEEVAQRLTEKYTPEQRKIIFEPIQKLLESNDFTITIRDPQNSFRKDSRILKTSKAFWNTLLPPPTLEQVEAEEEQRNKFFTFVLSIQPGQNFTGLTRKSLQENLLFSQETKETLYELPNPTIIDGKEILLRKPLKLILSIDDNNHLQLYNEGLELSAEGEEKNFNDIVEDIKMQFYSLMNDFKTLEESNPTKFNLLKQYL